MTAVTTLADARALLDELSPKPQLPAIIFAQMCGQIDITPPDIDLKFAPWPELVPTIGEAIEGITGTPYGVWQHSDRAALLNWLNQQATQAHPIIESDAQENTDGQAASTPGEDERAEGEGQPEPEVGAA